MMLVLSRDCKLKREVVLTLPDGRSVRVIVQKINGSLVSLAFDAPKDFGIRRGEIQERAA